MGSSLTPDFWLCFLSAAKSHNAPQGPQEASETAEHRGILSQGEQSPSPCRLSLLHRGQSVSQGTICVPGKDGSSLKRREGVAKFPTSTCIPTC